MKEEHKSYTSNLETMNFLFESSLKPLRSKYARAIFNIFLESMDIEYLTTLDIQKGLLSNRMTLSKKEINAWLKSLHSSFLISKSLERGKPTTIDYDDKYTYDKWSITSKGKLLSNGLYFLRITLNDDVKTDYDDEEMNQTILSLVKKSNGIIELNSLKDKILNTQGFEKKLSKLKNQGLIIENNNMRSILERFLLIIGIKVPSNTILRLTEKGKKILE